MDLLVGLLAFAILVCLPLLLLWTGAVFASRLLRDRPVGLSAATDVLLTGVQLGLLWLLLAIPGALAGFIGVVASAFWPGESHWQGPSITTGLTFAGLVFVAVSWFWFRPTLCEEWDRLAR